MDFGHCNCSKILPQEVWCMILRQLKTPEDQENAANCCSNFWKTLLDKRVGFLFPRILNTLLAWKTEIPEPHTDKTPLEPCLTKTELFKSRLVCSAWNSAVEKCYATPAMRGLFPVTDTEHKQTTGILDPNILANPYVFDEILQVRAFISNFVDGRTGVLKNPFLGRFVIININDRHTRILYDMVVAITRILTIFGSEIWHIILDFKFFCFEKGYFVLKEMLEYMPNLKSLRLQFLQPNNVEPDVVFFNPLPMLDKLDYLEVQNVDINLLNKVFHKYNKVSNIVIRDSKCEINWSPTLLDNLKGLYVDGCKYHCSDLLELTSNKSKIKSLFVYIREDRPSYLRKSFSELFQIVEKYVSLINLTLTFGYQVKAFVETKHLQLKLPQLHRLQLFSNEIICIDFVQQLGNLKYLDITLQLFGIHEAEDLHNSIDQNIEFIGFENKMHQSNIWDKMGSLKVLKVNMTRRNRFVFYEYTKENSGVAVRRSFIRKPRTPKFNLPYFQYGD